MWSGPVDRTRAEVEAQKLTPSQLVHKGTRERCFNAGFDAAIRATTPSEVLRMVHFNHPKYVADRRERFERWDLVQRVEAARREKQ
jgi:hypothetical protein